MIDGLRHGFRFLVVAREFARHDALFWLDDLGQMPVGLKSLIRFATFFVRHKKDLPDAPGARLADVLRQLGPSYIKLGQMLATRSDLIGPGMARNLRNLQDRLPPFPSDIAIQQVEDDLGKPLDQLFSDFDPEPVAAASIAQVHKARTTEGMDVAVKIVRPDIAGKFARDLEAFAWAARFAERSIPRTRRLRPVAVVNTVAASVATELDLRLEAAAASELAENMAGEPGYRIPAIDWQRTSRNVLTLEWVDGIALSDTEQLDAAGFDRAELAAVIVRAFLLQAMRDGFFHADLHQGNLFVEPDGTVVALDFGITGQLDKSSRRYLAEIIYGFLQRDYQRVARWHFSAGYVPADRSEQRFAQAMRAVAEPIFGRAVRDVSAGKLLGQLFATTDTFGMETQPQLLLLQRTMVMVEGMALHLDSDANMWELSRPVIDQWMRDQLSPEIALADAINQSLQSVQMLPGMVGQVKNVLDGLEKSMGGQSNGGPLKIQRRMVVFAMVIATASIIMSLIVAL